MQPPGQDDLGRGEVLPGEPCAVWVVRYGMYSVRAFYGAVVVTDGLTRRG